MGENVWRGTSYHRMSYGRSYAQSWFPLSVASILLPGYASENTEVGGRRRTTSLTDIESPDVDWSIRLRHRCAALTPSFSQPAPMQMSRG
ncbi:hypothetical protein PILCRDRAFT_814535 [Piloderma croceum F 1598]|uniref:Uncharacterized protein n=1 Tax=Piloderma croceum (strain F 1598) TaxID=765440 RepID=A0A0C3GB11_PILCF|nr:hypothetical protein PILCRDRAFT_814535 [Piloderma croceum F 1598]